MKCKTILLSLGVITLLHFGPPLVAQESEGLDLEHDVRGRQERFTKMSTEDQLKIRSATLKAMDDPAVKKAIEKRNAAVREFRATMRASMLKIDPSIEPLLDQVNGPKK